MRTMILIIGKTASNRGVIEQALLKAGYHYFYGLPFEMNPLLQNVAMEIQNQSPETLEKFVDYAAMNNYKLFICNWEQVK